MAGLLDYQPDPIAASLLGFASGALTPVSRGGGLGAGLLGASQGMAQARQEAMQIEQMRQAQIMQELQRRKMESELSMAPAHADAYRAQADLSRMKVDQAKAAMEQQRRLQAALQAAAQQEGGMSPPSDAIATEPGVRNRNPFDAMAQNAPAMPQQAPSRMSNYNMLMQRAKLYEANGAFEEAQKLRDAAAKNLPEITKIEQVTDEQNRLKTRQWFKDGTFQDVDAQPFEPNKAFNVQGGRVVPNMDLQRYELGKASAGATRVNIPINTERTYYGNVAEGLAKQDLGAIEAAKGAGAQIERAQRIRDALSKNPITGTLAEQRLGLNKALATVGLVDPGQAAATEALQSDLAKLTLGAIRSSGLGSGQGFTDKDRMFLERAESGNIESTPQNLARIADLSERAARESLRRGQDVANRLKGAQGMGVVGPSIQIDQPQAPAKQRSREDILRQYGVK